MVEAEVEIVVNMEAMRVLPTPTWMFLRQVLVDLPSEYSDNILLKIVSQAVYVRG